MFTGEYKHTLDSKNRVSIPARFRDELGDKFFITKGLDNCLFVFSAGEWQKFQERLSQLPLTNKSARAFARVFLSGASECSTDKMGRTLVPQYLKDFAGLEKEVYVNGAGSRIEIWSADSWTDYASDIGSNINDLAEGMESLGVSF